MGKRILPLLLALALCLGLAGCAVSDVPAPAPTAAVTPAPTPVPTPAPAPPPVPVPPRHVIHAGGEIAGRTLTNAREALMDAYGAGMRYIELDFSLTADGEVVCLHDWNTQCLPGYGAEDFPLTRADFMAAKLYGELTPMSLDTLALFLGQLEGLFIITDTKDDNLALLEKLAAEQPALQSRFIPQIYHQAELEPVRALGYEQVIYTLYAEDGETKADAAGIAAFAAEGGLWAVTFPWELTETPGYVETLLESGVPLYTHTVNGAEAVEAQLALGLTGVYTDQYRQGSAQ